MAQHKFYRIATHMGLQDPFIAHNYQEIASVLNIPSLRTLRYSNILIILLLYLNLLTI